MGLWGDVRIPIVMASGAVNSGKTLFGLTIDPNCRRPASEVKPTTLVYDQEGSADSYVGALNFEHKDVRAAVGAGVHREVVQPDTNDPNWLKILKQNADVNDSPSASMFRAWYLSLIKVPTGQYAVGMCDTFTPLQEGLIEWLKRHPQAFGRSLSEYTKLSTMTLWPDIKSVLSHILAVDCRLRFETFVLTVHLKNEWAGGKKTGNKIAEGLDTLEKLATLHLELDRSPTAKGKEAPRVPSAILKKERLVVFGASADEDRPVLPPRIPKATPDAIREYIKNPPDFAKLSAAERLPDDSLSEDQRLLIQQQTAQYQAEAETAKLSAIELARQAAARPVVQQQAPQQPAAQPTAQPTAEMASVEQCTEIISLVKQAFANGQEAVAWMQSKHGVDHPSKLSDIRAIEVIAELRGMTLKSQPSPEYEAAMKVSQEVKDAKAKAAQQQEQQQEAKSEPAAEADAPAAITQEQRDKIRELTFAIYDKTEGCKQQDAWLRSLGYSAIRSCTAAQADARIVELTESLKVGATAGDDNPF